MKEVINYSKIEKLQDKVSGLTTELMETRELLRAAASAAGWNVPDGPSNFNPISAIEAKNKIEKMFKNG